MIKLKDIPNLVGSWLAQGVGERQRETEQLARQIVRLRAGATALSESEVESRAGDLVVEFYQHNSGRHRYALAEARETLAHEQHGLHAS